MLSFVTYRFVGKTRTTSMRLDDSGRGVLSIARPGGYPKQVEFDVPVESFDALVERCPVAAFEEAEPPVPGRVLVLSIGMEDDVSHVVAPELGDETYASMLDHLYEIAKRCAEVDIQPNDDDLDDVSGKAENPFEQAARVEQKPEVSWIVLLVGVLVLALGQVLAFFVSLLLTNQIVESSSATSQTRMVVFAFFVPCLSMASFGGGFGIGFFAKKRDGRQHAFLAALILFGFNMLLLVNSQLWWPLGALSLFSLLFARWGGGAGEAQRHDLTDLE